MATILIRMTSAPYGTNSAEEGLDFAISATNFGHEVLLVFEGEGLYQLIMRQQPEGTPNHAKRLTALPFFDIEECFYSELSLQLLGLSESVLGDVASPVTEKELQALYNKANHVVTF
ncbi:DsrE family protein [Alteromonas ponticola]|uniref:DsrE family protein n=1 Tax=Alteromonas aquimaris TaxID=2998417 RepID=A0ABT3P5P3_9ALTE|nr:DsrE family protein [Alteromonas aquimaris]MCW8108089.1 DsrE family protein [Alteromonas aquimaris]